MSMIDLFLDSNDYNSNREFQKISVSNNLLVLPGNIIQLSNISRVSSYQIKKKFAVKALCFCLTLLCLLIATYTKEFDSFYLGAAIFGALFVYMFTYERVGLHIQTNGNTSDFLITENQEIADKLYNIIAYFICNRDIKNSITIDKSLNVTIGDQILGDKFNKIKNSKIFNRSSRA